MISAIGHDPWRPAGARHTHLLRNTPTFKHETGKFVLLKRKAPGDRAPRALRPCRGTSARQIVGFSLPSQARLPTFRLLSRTLSEPNAYPVEARLIDAIGSAQKLRCLLNRAAVLDGSLEIVDVASDRRCRVASSLRGARTPPLSSAHTCMNRFVARPRQRHPHPR